MALAFFPCQLIRFFRGLLFQLFRLFSGFLCQPFRFFLFLPGAIQEIAKPLFRHFGLPWGAETAAAFPGRVGMERLRDGYFGKAQAFKALQNIPIGVLDKNGVSICCQLVQFL